MEATLVIPRVEEFEGRVRHMYQCTGGKVTIGIGHAIETPEDALTLPWTVGGRPATAEEIRAGYGKVAAAEKGLAAKAYAPLSECRLADADIDALIAADVAGFTAQLAAALPNWDTYPAPAQAALFDMAFNLGIGGLKKFPSMRAAADAGRWDVAAAQCQRKGIGEGRNQATAALFLQAAG